MTIAIEIEAKKMMATVGFEPTHPECYALTIRIFDHYTTLLMRVSLSM
jgi:hypothetical protein